MDETKLKLFYKYNPVYDKDYGDVKNIAENLDAAYSNKESAKIANQIYVFKKLSDEQKGLTEIKDLIRMTSNEINAQYARKVQFENRAGFLIAMWGILFSALVQNKALQWWIKNDFIKQILSLKMLIIICVMVFLCSSFYFIYRVLISGEYRFFPYNDRGKNYGCAVDDSCLYYIRVLEIMTTCWESNEENVNKKGKDFNIAIKLITALSIIVFLSYIVF